MTVTFVILAGLLLASSLAAVLFRRLVHNALSLVVAFSSLAAIYLELGAEFVGFAQLLVYVGAVAVLIVFVLLLTRNAGYDPEQPQLGASWATGVAIAGLVFGCIALSILTSHVVVRLPRAGAAPEATPQQIGQQLMSGYVLPLEALGLLLTAAAIGAAVLALADTRKDSVTR